MQATFGSELVRIHVAEFADPAESHLWQLRQEPACLLESSSSLCSMVPVIEALISITRTTPIFVSITLGRRCGYFR